MSLFFNNKKKKPTTSVAAVPATTSTAPVVPTITELASAVKTLTPVESINLAPIESIATLKQQITDLTCKNEALTKQMNDMEQSYKVMVSSFDRTAEGRAAQILASTGCPPVAMVPDQTDITGNDSYDNLPIDRTARIAALGNQLKSQQANRR
jgi:hypothetical protein